MAARDASDAEDELILELILNILRGKDAHIDYSKVDSNQAYDDVKISSQDDEDKFFSTDNFEINPKSTDTGIQDF